MKTVTDAFKTALVKSRGEGTREVSYKRRVWNQVTRTYGWESSWQTIGLDQLVSVSTINQQLDTDQLNEFKVSNVTITLKNQDNRWREDNPSGVFGQDSDSPTFSYNPYMTKFRVRVGFKLSDGTMEYVTMFTGTATEYTYASNDQVQVTIQGMESLLINASAEEVSTRVGLEIAGTGNGLNKDFTTANPGVGIIDEVSLNGIKQQAGTAYNVSQLDEPTLGAKISFTTAPGSGVVVRISYRFWQQNKRIEELVIDLLTEAGVASANQNVNPVIFSNPILDAVVIDSQADWQAGTPTSIDYATELGSIKVDILDPANYELLDDFADGDYTSNPVWTPEGGGVTWSVPSNRLRYDKAGVTAKGVLHTPANGAQIGLWKWVMNGWGPSYDKVTFAFMASAVVNDPTWPFYPYTFQGNCLKLLAPPYSGDGNLKWELYINDVLVASTSYNPPMSSDFTVKVIRLASGWTGVYVDQGSGFQLILSGQSPANVVHSWFGIATEMGAFIITDREMDNFYRPKSIFTGTWSSPTYDLTGGVIAIGKLFADFAVGDGTVTFQTRTSTNGSSWDAWTTIAANGQVLSDIHRYLQIRVIFSHPSSSYQEPIVRSVRVEFQTSVANITLAKFTGKTVYDAIQILGQFSNYEWGFDADEVFFFRAKTTDKQESDELDRSDVRLISAMTTGYDRVYSEIRVAYGNFNAIITGSGVTPDDPIAKFGTRVFETSVTDVIIGNDADVAQGVAKIFFADLSKPKRRLKAACRFLPHVELSDRLLLSFDQNRPRKAWHIGDETVSLGDRDTDLWGDRSQIVSGMRVKVIGARHDIQKYSTEFDLEEVP